MTKMPRKWIKSRETQIATYLKKGTEAIKTKTARNAKGLLKPKLPKYQKSKSQKSQSADDDTQVEEKSRKAQKAKKAEKAGKLKKPKKVKLSKNASENRKYQKSE